MQMSSNCATYSYALGLLDVAQDTSVINTPRATARLNYAKLCN